MHDEHVEDGLGQGPDTQPLHKHVVDCGGEGNGTTYQASEGVEASTTTGRDRDKVIHKLLLVRVG